MDGASRPAVIIDNGSGYTKMGFAGNLEPSFVVPTAVALNESFATASAVGSLSPAQLRSAGVMTDLDFFIGHDAIAAARTGNYTLTYPIRRGRVVNWDSMERLWQHCLFNFLRVDPEDHMLMLTESPLTPPEHREYTAEIMFETFNVAGLYIGGQPMLSLMAANAAAQTPLTGVVVDVGDGSTSVVPVAEGYVIGGSIRSMPIGGSHVTAFVQQLMRERGEAVPPEEAMEVARRVKEAYGYTCADIVKEFGKHDREPAKFRKVYRGTNSRTGAPFQCDVGHERFLAAEAFFSPDILGSITGASSAAAGGKSSAVGDGYGMGAPSPVSVSGSGEALPSLPELVDLAIQSAPIDTRRALYKTIVLAGGSSQFKDFGRRLQRDVKRLVDVRQGRASSAPLTSAGSPAPPEDASGAGSVEVAVVSHHMQSHAAWFGGSVVGATPAFPSLCHTRAQYEEYGAAICRTTAIVKGM